MPRSLAEVHQYFGGTHHHDHQCRLIPWHWGQGFPPKCRYSTARLHGVTSQKTVIFTATDTWQHSISSSSSSQSCRVAQSEEVASHVKLCTGTGQVSGWQHINRCWILSVGLILSSVGKPSTVLQCEKTYHLLDEIDTHTHTVLWFSTCQELSRAWCAATGKSGTF